MAMRKLSWLKRACGVCILSAAAAIAASAQTFTTLHSFDITDGYTPYAALVQATNGNLYGTTSGGNGTVFKITPSGELTTLHTFNGFDGSSPQADLVQATDGNLYGTTQGGGAHAPYGTVFKITPAGILTTLYSFCSKGASTDGANPLAGLLQAVDGNFYGTTATGGTKSNGTVFKITPAGTLTTLYSFCSQSGCPDGANPSAGLVQATDGNLYGTTSFGGSASCFFGCGTVFKITPSGTLTTLHSFDGTDGQSPSAALVLAKDGNFYGTTQSGGANGAGAVFKIAQSGELTTLYSFCPQSGCSDGEFPFAALVQASDGNLYGTTSSGGANDFCSFSNGEGCGTIFKISTGGVLATLHSFCADGGSACTDGATPLAALVQDTNGHFYGTTYVGGANGNHGTVFGLSVGLGAFVETQPTFGKVGKIIKILGTKLTGATSVTFNGTAATFTVVSGTEISATVPTNATTGPVRVATPSGTLTSNVNFQVLP